MPSLQVNCCFEAASETNYRSLELQPGVSTRWPDLRESYALVGHEVLWLPAFNLAQLKWVVLAHTLLPSHWTNAISEISAKWDALTTKLLDPWHIRYLNQT